MNLAAETRMLSINEIFMRTNTVLDALKKCSHTKNIERGVLIHLGTIQNLIDSEIFVANALMNMYSKCGSMIDAQYVFETIQRPTVVSWNVLVLGYASNGKGERALEMFSEMGYEGIVPDALTFVAALKAYTEATKEDKLQGKLEKGMVLHMHAVANGCHSDAYLGSALVNMYARFGSMVDSQKAFEILQHPDVVAWTALIMGYVENGESLIALKLFSSLDSEGCQPNALTFFAALRACSNMLDVGMAIHSRVIQNGCECHVKVANMLVEMYSSCGCLLDARMAFKRIQHPNVVSWTALISGHVENGEADIALQLFSCMKREGCIPNARTFLAVLKACSMTGNLQIGKAVHAEIRKHCFDSHNAVLVTCLVDFYCKCGSMLDAQEAFDSLSKKDLIAWNALMSGYTLQGDAERVFELFCGMQDTHLQLDEGTFLCVLSACNHSGLVDKGKVCFDAMSSKYEIQPNVEHYTCMADILGRANRLEDAFALIKGMPFTPNEVTWTTLLCACKKWKNVELGMLAFEALLSLGAHVDAGTFMLIANM